MAVKGLSRGEEAMREQYSVSAVYKLFHACLENAPQTTLQIYIIITTWGKNGSLSKKQINLFQTISFINNDNHLTGLCMGSFSNQVVYIVLGLVGLSKAISDDQFWRITDKIPGLGTIHIPNIYQLTAYEAHGVRGPLCEFSTLFYITTYDPSYPVF